MVDVVDITTAGWDGVNAESPLPVRYNESEQAEIDRTLARVFETEDGQKIMQWLVESYLLKPCWTAGYDQSFGHHREGQNTLIRELQTRANRAKE
tara:strand:- start:33 stop:317 length:285 start_codon:yes stop_codon:yes gene_type:complete